MSLSAYRERQDRTFDTFRNKFGIVRGSSREAVPQIDANPVSSTRENGRTRAISSATCRDILVNISDHDEEPGHNKESERVVFAPQIRRLDIAPWEGEMTRDDSIPRPDKKSRSSILSKFRRKSTRNSRLGEADSGLRAISPSLSTSPTPSSPGTPRSAIFKDESDTSSGPTTPMMTDAAENSDLQQTATSECEIKFLPVDPNILHLKRPISVIHEDGEVKAMKPSSSTPQIHYEIFETPKRAQDRMSRMFDGLKFN